MNAVRRLCQYDPHETRCRCYDKVQKRKLKSSECVRYLFVRMAIGRRNTDDYVIDCLLLRLLLFKKRSALSTLQDCHYYQFLNYSHDCDPQGHCFVYFFIFKNFTF